MTGDLKMLLRLAEMARDAELGRLRRHAESLRQVESERRALRDAKTAAQAQAAADPAHVSGAADRWLDWADAQQSRLAARAAAIAAELEDHKLAASRAFGRAQALSGLVEKAEDERRTRLRRPGG